MPSQTHDPPTQWSPGPHSAPAPHAQLPSDAQPSDDTGSQAMHASPPEPHRSREGIRQTSSASQQPVGHDVASHTHAPMSQRWPAEHAAIEPHWHVPAEEQLLETVASQATQVPPPVPQVVTSRVRQSVPSQQPLGHEVSSHTQRPAAQRCPGSQGGPSPQRHSPVTQRPARIESQGMHASPAGEQAESACGLQTEPEQQPSGHVIELHDEQIPASQVSPSAQAEHSEPPVPHSEGESPGRHSSPAQQPSQDIVSQTQASPLQRCPAAQAGPSPQPIAQVEVPAGTASHIQPGSTLQSGAQPSPGSELPSSQPSKPSRHIPSPHSGTAPRWTSSSMIIPPTRRPETDSAATSAPPLIP